MDAITEVTSVYLDFLLVQSLFGTSSFIWQQKQQPWEVDILFGRRRKRGSGRRIEKNINKWLTQSHMSSQHPGLMPEFEWSSNVVYPQIDNAM